MASCTTQSFLPHGLELQRNDGTLCMAQPYQCRLGIHRLSLHESGMLPVCSTALYLYRGFHRSYNRPELRCRNFDTSNGSFVTHINSTTPRGPLQTLSVVGNFAGSNVALLTSPLGSDWVETIIIEDQLALVSSLYGPGTVTAWYLTILSVLIS